MENSKLSQEVLNKIKKDDIKMKSEMHFALRAILWVAATVSVLLLGLFVVSFIFFVYRANALDAFHVLGASGIGPILKALPWILIITALVIVVVLEMLGKHFAFVYKKPLVYSMLVVLIILVFGGMAIGRTQLHEKAFELALEHRLPVAGRLYDRFGNRALENVNHGTIIKVTDGGFIMEARNGKTFNVQITKQTKVPLNYEPKINQRIIVLGMPMEDDIRAIGIKPAFERRFPSRGRLEMK